MKKEEVDLISTRSCAKLKILRKATSMERGWRTKKRSIQSIKFRYRYDDDDKYGFDVHGF